MLPGVRPSMSLASLPTASTRPVTLLMATMEGSLTTIPLPRAYTQVLAVPRSMARSLENSESIERRLKKTPCAPNGDWETGTDDLYIGWSGRDLNAVLAGGLYPVHGPVGGL